MFESAMQALERLKERNQALVNKLGKTTAYSRESDEIITVLARALWSLGDADTKLSKLFALGDILGVDLENGIDRIPEESPYRSTKRTRRSLCGNSSTPRTPGTRKSVSESNAMRKI